MQEMEKQATIKVDCRIEALSFLVSFLPYSPGKKTCWLTKCSARNCGIRLHCILLLGLLSTYADESCSSSSSGSQFIFHKIFPAWSDTCQKSLCYFFFFSFKQFHFNQQWSKEIHFLITNIDDHKKNGKIKCFVNFSVLQFYSVPRIDKY